MPAEPTPHSARRLIVTGPRIRREQHTVAAMIELYCHEHHAEHYVPAADGAVCLCDECRSVHDYAMQRLERCPFQEGKTTCAKCRVHCYKPAQREQIRVIMRYSGPRMLWRHPVLAVHHLLDGRREEPLPRANPARPQP